MALGAVKALEQRYQEQQDRVRKAQSELDSIRNDLGISVADAQGSSPSPSVDADALRKLQTQMIEGSARLDELRVTLMKLKALSLEDFKQVLPRLRPDSILNEHMSQLNLAEQQLVQMKKDFNPEHPQFIRVHDQVETLKKKVDESVAAIMTSMDIQLVNSQDGVDMLKKQIEDAKQRDIEKALKDRPYFDKKRELEGLQGFARIVNMKLAAEKIDVVLPKSSMVEIMDRAVPGVRPVRPNKPLNLFLGAVMGMVLGSGVAGIVAWWIHRLRRKAAGNPAMP